VELEKFYIVAATPRTGSSLLCEGLRSTEIAGHPVEVFAPLFRGMWYRRLLLRSSTRFEDFFLAALKYGTSINGVYGLKIQWMHVAKLAKDLSFKGETEDVFDAYFPGARFVNIVRRNRREQAISWYRAIATNEWWRINSNNRHRMALVEPKFDTKAIQSLEIEIDRQQKAWDQFFSTRRISPLVVEYENLSKDYNGQVASVLSFLNLDSAKAMQIPPPRLIKQADKVTAEWCKLMEVTHGQEVRHE